MEIKDLELTELSQEFFDGFNLFMMSKDSRVFNKLIARCLLYDSVKSIPGDIVECGVFKGTGVYTFLKLKRVFNPNSYKKIIGFDFFNTEELLNSVKNDLDKETMSSLFHGRSFSHESSYKDLLEKKLINDGFSKNEFELVAGDISETSKNFVALNPGFKISLLYLDLDIEVPTYNTLINLWDSLSTGAIVIFDQYGYHKWSESIAVDKFVKQKQIKLHTLNFQCPTAYFKKE